MDSILDEKIYKLNDLLRRAEELKFDRYHKIVLSAERNKFRKLNPNLKFMLINPAKLFNKGDVLKKYNKYIENKYNFKAYKVRKIKGGHIHFYVNAIKIFLTYIDNDKKLRKQLKDVIRYLIEEDILQAKSCENHILNYYLRKFNFNEIEFNFIFRDPELFEFLMKSYNFLDCIERSNKLDNLGCRKKGLEKERAIERDMNLSIYNTTIYIFDNISSKLLFYNINAEKEKRDFSLDADEYKAELMLKKQYLKDAKRKNIDENILQKMKQSVMFQKVYQDVIIKPIRCERTRYLILKRMNEKTQLKIYKKNYRICE